MAQQSFAEFGRKGSGEDAQAGEAGMHDDNTRRSGGWGGDLRDRNGVRMKFEVGSGIV